MHHLSALRLHFEMNSLLLLEMRSDFENIAGLGIAFRAEHAHERAIRPERLVKHGHQQVADGDDHQRIAGEFMDVAAKPARKVVKVLPLKALKDMAAK